MRFTGLVVRRSAARPRGRSAAPGLTVKRRRPALDGARRATMDAGSSKLSWIRIGKTKTATAARRSWCLSDNGRLPFLIDICTSDRLRIHLWRLVMDGCATLRAQQAPSKDATREVYI